MARSRLSISPVNIEAVNKAALDALNTASFKLTVAGNTPLANSVESVNSGIRTAKCKFSATLALTYFISFSFIAPIVIPPNKAGVVLSGCPSI